MKRSPAVARAPLTPTEADGGRGVETHTWLIGPQRGKSRTNSAVKHFYDMLSGSTGRSWHPHLGTASTRTRPEHPTTHGSVPRAKASRKGPSAPYVSQRAPRPRST